MKKALLLLMATLTVLGLNSCRKGGVSLFAGDYSFKTSGEVSITATANINDDNLIIPAVLNASLSNDIGQLNISASDNSNDEVIVIINYLNGDVITTTGTCDGKTIILNDFQRNTLPVSVNIPFSSGSTYITVSAIGQMYDNDMIVFDMSYRGQATVWPLTYSISDKDIQMVAYRN